MLLASWLRNLRAVVRRVPHSRPHPVHRPRRNRCRPAVEPLEGRLVLSASAPQTVVYVETNNPNPGQNAVLAYHSDPVDGSLTLFGTFPTGGTGGANPTDGLGPDDSDQEIVVSPDHRFLFAVNSGSNTIAVFDIHADGSLSLIKGAPFDSGGVQPVSLGLAGNDLYVVNQGDQVPGQTSGGVRPNYTGFHVNGNGKLHPIANSTVEVNPGSSPSQALITPDGQFLFGSDLFSVRLDPPPPLPPFIPPFASALEGFRIQPNGRLAQVPGTPHTTFADTPLPPFVLGLHAHPTQRIIYAGFVAGNELGVYTYDAAGQLSFAGTVPSSGLGICWITASPDAKYLYASNSTSDSIAVFSIADPLHPVEIQNLDLAGPKAPLPFFAPTIFDTTPFQLSTDPTGKFLYAVNHETASGASPLGNALHVLQIGTGGTLTESLGPTFLPVPALANPLGVVVLQVGGKAAHPGAAGSAGAARIAGGDAERLAALDLIYAATRTDRAPGPLSQAAASVVGTGTGKGAVAPNLPAAASPPVSSGDHSGPRPSTLSAERASHTGWVDDLMKDWLGSAWSAHLK
jgi:6-phosphogluconolactonase (cycloisomerase 2 family)